MVVRLECLVHAKDGNPGSRCEVDALVDETYLLSQWGRFERLPELGSQRYQFPSEFERLRIGIERFVIRAYGPFVKNSIVGVDELMTARPGVDDVHYRVPCEAPRR